MKTRLFPFVALAALPWVARADTVTLTSVADAYVSRSDPTHAYGAETKLRTYVDAAGEDSIGLIEFDLSAIPPEATINGAYLELYVTYTEGAPANITVWGVDSTWEEHTVTWLTPRTLSSSPWGPATIIGSGAGFWVHCDVRDLVAAWRITPELTLVRSLAVRGPPSSHLFEFCSREGACPPRLVVDYTPAPPDGQIVVTIDQAWAFRRHTDTVTGNEQDFYVIVKVNGVDFPWSRIIEGKDHASWTLPLSFTANVRRSQRYYEILVDLYDEDDWPDPDDHFDLSHSSGRELKILFDACNGTWIEEGQPETYGPTADGFEWMPRTDAGIDCGTGPGDCGQVHISIRTGDGRSFAPNDVNIEKAGPVQTVFGAKKIIAEKATAFGLQLGSTWTVDRAAHITVTLRDYTQTLTDVKYVVIPPSGLKVFLFDGTALQVPFVPRYDEKDPYLHYSVTVDVEGEPTVPVPPWFNCSGENNMVSDGVVKIITTASLPVRYVGWDWDDSSRFPSSVMLDVTAAANELFRAAIFPINVPVRDVERTDYEYATPYGPYSWISWLSGGTLEPAETIWAQSHAAPGMHVDRLVLMPRRGWFGFNASRLRFGADGIGFSLGEYAPHAVIAEASYPQTAVHEIGHTYAQSQHPCGDPSLLYRWFGLGCRDEYEHTAADGYPYLGYGYDVQGQVYPAGAGLAPTPGSGEVDGLSNFMDRESGFVTPTAVSWGRWIDTFTFDDLSDRLRTSQDPQLLAVAGAVRAANGLGAPDPGLMATLLPGYQTTGTPDMSPATPTAPSGSGLFALRLQTLAGDYVYLFTPRFFPAPGGGDVGFFAFTIPWETNVIGLELAGAVDLQNPNQMITLTAQTRSAAAPTIAALRAGVDVAPKFGGAEPPPPSITPGHSVILAWQAGDVDSTNLTATLYLAPEPASNSPPKWLPYGIQIPVSQMTIPYGRLAVAPGLYRGRLIVSDGLNSTELEVTNLFEIGTNTPPKLIRRGSAWRYLDNGSDPGTAWRGMNFDDSSWKTGPAKLGYGEGDEATVVSFGNNPNNKYITTYFRQTFTPANLGSLYDLVLRLQRNDGVIAYLNGVEILRNNMPTGAVTSVTLASQAVSRAEEGVFATVVNPPLIYNGQNLLAVEVHQNATNSPDLSFDLELFAQPQPPTNVIVQVPAGYSTIANNFNRGSDTLNEVIPVAEAGTLILKWNFATQAFQTNIYDELSASWIPNGTLAPGEGAWICSPAAQTITFTGELPPAPGPITRPGTPGLRLVGGRAPVASTFEELLGFPPAEGDEVLTYDRTFTVFPTVPSAIHVFSAGVWTPTEPIVSPGKAVFVNLAPLLSPPTITVQPQSQTVSEGTAVALSVVATGTPPLAYQWQRNGTNLAGMTANYLLLDHATLADAGDYSVRVSNGAGQTTSSNAVLTVTPLACPSIECSSNLVVNCEGPSGAAVPYTVLAANPCNPSDLFLSCVPPSGSLFAVGTTVVKCTATAPLANRSTQCSFTVTVLSNCPPPCLTLQCPSNMVVSCESPGGAVVSYTPTATNRCDPTNLALFCEPPSPNFFPVGTTLVTCTAIGSGENTQCSFTVTVLNNCPFSNLTPPRLTITPLAGCLLQVCWTDPGTNYALQSATSLTPPIAWQPVDAPVSTLNGQSCVVLSNACQGTMYFRMALARLPVLSVLGPAVTPAQFTALNAQLKLPSTAYETNGAVLFTDANYFMRLPTEVLGDPGTRDEEGVPLVAERLLFDQINQIQVVSDQTALQQAQQLFATAGLMPTGMVVALPEVVHAQFSAVTSNGIPVCDLPIDTKVRYSVSVGGIPIVGPGAKGSITFGENGIVTHINYSLRRLTAGPTLPLPPPNRAYDVALSAYQSSLGQQQGVFALTSELVYYAPPPEFASVQTLFPHYQFSGTFAPGGTQNVIRLRTVLIPAITDSNTVPRVQLSVSSQSNSISAQATIAGGQPPYHYRWGSCTTALAAPDAPSVSYHATVRNGVETLVLLVSDANGLSATAGTNISLTGGAPGKGADGGHATKDAPTIDVGAEWIGSTASPRLDRAPANGNGFVSRFGPADGIVRFNWGEGNAFERDFKDPLFGGDDNNWVDNVDAVFYTGHANGDGWVFTSSQDDGFLRYSEARFGQNDLEWLVIAACGPLQVGPAYNAWWQRWGPAFQGLHLLCGYDNNSHDTTDEGRKWADYMLLNMTVAQAWTRAGIETQWGDGLRVAVMGVYGSGGLANWADHFWGHGSVGPDIRTVVGYWIALTPVD